MGGGDGGAGGFAVKKYRHSAKSGQVTIKCNSETVRPMTRAKIVRSVVIDRVNSMEKVQRPKSLDS